MGPTEHSAHRLSKNLVRLSLAWLCIVALAAGCSPVKTVKKTGRQLSQMTTWSGDDLIKKIGFVDFINQSTFPDQPYAKFFQQKISEQFAEICPDLRQAGGENRLTMLPMQDNGMVDNLTLAAAGRQLGLNALVTGAVISVGAFQRSEGWFWFKSPHYYAQIQVATDVYDTQTGAKLLYESMSTEIEIDGYQHDAIRAGNIKSVGAVETALAELSELAAEKICDSLAQIPWIGYVAAVSESGLVLNAGSAAGLESGQLFDVLPTERVYTGKDGQEYLVPGLPTAQIQITAVDPDRAEAVLVSGKMPVIGDAVRLED